MKDFLKAGLLLCLLVFNIRSFSQSITKDAPQIGSTPPPLTFSQVVQGPKQSEISWDKLRGKVVVLEFWNTACGPCIKAIPHLNDLVEQFSGKPVVFISISDDNPDRLKMFLLRKPIKSWLALDGPFSPTKAAFEIDGIPTMFIIDKSGTIVAITHPAKLEARHLEEVLAGKPSSLPLPAVYTDEDIGSLRDPETKSNSTPTKAMVSIRGPFPQPDGAFNFRSWNEGHTVFEANKAFVGDALAEFFGVNRRLVVGEFKLPEGLYDIAVSVPTNQTPELQTRFTEMVKTNLGISVQLTNREMNVYVVTVCSTNVSGLKQVEKRDGGGGGFGGGFRMGPATMDSVVSFFENFLDKPIVNATGLSGLWKVDIKWKMSEEELLPYQLDKRILELADTNPQAIVAGDLPKGLRAKISDHDLELLQAELAKPEDQQFQPNPTNVIKAARELLGLEFKPAKRKLTVLEVRSANQGIRE